MTHTYNLTTDGLAVTAVLTFNGSHGLLLCSYGDRSISVRLGSQVEYMREDACRALKSRRVMADMVGEAPYSRTATCRSIANRLDLLVQQGDIEADAAQEVVTEIMGKWRGLQTSHDFDRFVSTNLVAKQHLALCKRMDDDFETIFAPALAKAIKEDIETDLEIGVTAAPDKDTGLAVAQSATDRVNAVLDFHGLPTADNYTAGIDIVDEEFAHLRGSLEESDDLASDRWTALTSVNEVLRCMLDDRGVPTSDNLGDNLRAVVEYLSAVEAAAAKWQMAGLAWQTQARDDADRLMNEAMLRMYPLDANPCHERLASRVFLPTGQVPRDLQSAADAPCGSLITHTSAVVRFPDGTGWYLFNSGTSGPDPLEMGWSWPPPDKSPASVLAMNLTKEECLLLANMNIAEAVAWCSARTAQTATSAAPWGIPRNLRVTSHKPTRFVEIAGDTTAGIEPVCSNTYERHYATGKETP
jgi:polyhydroxyalkanoate synthesis regulator phasin